MEQVEQRTLGLIMIPGWCVTGFHVEEGSALPKPSPRPPLQTKQERLREQQNKGWDVPGIPLSQSNTVATSTSPSKKKKKKRH